MQRREPLSTRTLARLCALLGVVTAFFILPLGSLATNPPHVYWHFPGIVGMAALGLALAVSARRTATGSDRAWTGFAAAIVCAALFPVLQSHLEMFFDFPWGLLVPLLTLLIIGGWTCHQRWLSVGTFASVLLCIVAAHTPPAGELPRTQTLGDVTVTVQSVRHNDVILSCDFALITSPGTQVGDICDLHSVRCTERVCKLMEVRCDTPHPWVAEEECQPNQMPLNVWTFPPDFANSADLEITVLQWPHEPAVSLETPLPSPQEDTVGTPLSAEGNGVRLTVTNVRRAAGRNTVPPEPRIALTVAAKNAGCIRARGDHGHVLPLRWSWYRAYHTTMYETNEAELLPIPKGLSRITIDAFTPEQVERNTLTFRFPRLPNR